MTNEQWMSAAEKSAAESWGRRHEGWFVFRRFGMVPMIVLIAGGLIGWAGYKLWTIAAGLFSGDGPGISTSSIVTAVVLTAATIFAYRPGRMPAYGVIALVKAMFFLLAWIALIGWTLGRI